MSVRFIIRFKMHGLLTPNTLAFLLAELLEESSLSTTKLFTVGESSFKRSKDGQFSVQVRVKSEDHDLWSVGDGQILDLSSQKLPAVKCPRTRG